MNVETRFISDPYSRVDTSLCERQDKYDFTFKTKSTNSSLFDQWLVWEGGIAFHIVYWLIIVVISMSIINIVRWKFRWQCLTERFVGQTHEPFGKAKDSGWILIDEKVVGQDGATYLWLQLEQIPVYTLIMVFSVVLIVLHHFGDKQGADKHLSSTTLSNIGVNGIHPVFCLTILVVLGVAMYVHGRKRHIRSLATPNIPNKFCNRRWLMISGLPLTTTTDSLFEYLKGRFDSKGICRDGIKLAYDLTELWPVIDEFKYIREVKRTLATSGPEIIIKNGFLNRLIEAVESVRVPRPSSLMMKYDNIDAMEFYSEREATLLAKKDEILRNLKFTGTAFVRFDSPAEAKATKRALRTQQSARFRNDVVEDADFLPSRWSVRYAPPDSQINWSQLKEPRQLWKNLAVWLILAVIYFFYIIIMAAPGYTVQLLQLVGKGSDDLSLSWDVFSVQRLQRPPPALQKPKFPSVWLVESDCLQSREQVE